MNWTLGYNTNGFAHHRLADAIDLLADIGYGAVAITLDHHALDPFSATLDADLERIRSQLRRRNLRCVIETGARFLLDARRKHRPTLVSAAPKDRARRAEFICHAVDIAGRLDADAVSFWSGALDAPGDHDAFNRLICGCQHCLEHAATRGVRLAFEPEPGMFIERMEQYERLERRVDHPLFGLTLDVGHVHCLGDGEPDDRIRQFAGRLFNVHIEDMCAGVHEHRMFGEGEMRFEPIIAALDAVGYDGCVCVELSRHSHDAVRAAQQAYDYLSRLIR